MSRDRDSRTVEAGAVSGTIVALGGGGFSVSETGASTIDDQRPRATAATAANVSNTHSPAVCRPMCCRSPRDYTDPRMLLDTDLIYVGGGSTANLLALWNRHGVDEIMCLVAADGVILAGTSSGANCWFEGSSTDSFGSLAPLSDGLGFIPGSACPHYHGESHRAEAFRDWIGSGRLPGPGIAIDDHAAVVFEDSALTSVVVEEPGGRAYVIERTNEGTVETPLAPS